MLDEASRTLFGCFCHQDPSRLLVVGGQLVQLCPRCVGLHLGFAISLISVSQLFRRGLILSRRGSRLLILLGLVVLALDWGVGGYLGLYSQTPYSRLLTGLACGSALAILLAAYRNSLWSIRVSDPPAASPVDLAGVMCSSIAVGTLMVAVSGWALLTSICAISVMVNVALVVNTAARMLRVRLRSARCVPLADASCSQGGAG